MFLFYGQKMLFLSKKSAIFPKVITSIIIICSYSFDKCKLFQIIIVRNPLDSVTVVKGKDEDMYLNCTQTDGPDTEQSVHF